MQPSAKPPALPLSSMKKKKIPLFFQRKLFLFLTFETTLSLFCKRKLFGIELWAFPANHPVVSLPSNERWFSIPVLHRGDGVSISVLHGVLPSAGVSQWQKLLQRSTWEIEPMPTCFSLGPMSLYCDSARPIIKLFRQNIETWNLASFIPITTWPQSPTYFHTSEYSVWKSSFFHTPDYSVWKS